MSEQSTLKTLGTSGLQKFLELQSAAVSAVTERFYTTHGALYERFGERGREFCREDLAFHLEFLRPVLEFGILQPMVDYLHWLNGVLNARTIPTEHLSVSLDWLAEFYAGQVTGTDAEIIGAAFLAARTGFERARDIPLTPLLARAPWPEVAEFETALLNGDQRLAHAVLHRSLQQGRTLVQCELHIIQPALYEIGEKWQANQVSVAQEHLATAIAQSVMAVALQGTQLASALGKRVLLACVEGNNHAVGLQMVADAFVLAGWEVQFLGANVPTSALINQAADWKPDLIGLSVSFPQQLRVAKLVIAQLGQRLGDARPAVMVGGLAFNRFVGLGGVVGADQVVSDSQMAVEYANRLL